MNYRPVNNPSQKDIEQMQLETNEMWMHIHFIAKFRELGPINPANKKALKTLKKINKYLFTAELIIRRDFNINFDYL